MDRQPRTLFATAGGVGVLVDAVAAVWNPSLLVSQLFEAVTWRSSATVDTETCHGGVL